MASNCLASLLVIGWSEYRLGLHQLQWILGWRAPWEHYGDVIMGEIASQITSLAIVYSAFYSGADQKKHQSPASLAFVRGIHRGPVNSPHKWPVARKMFPFDDVIMLKPFFKGHWQSPCTALTAGKCFPSGLCKETVKLSIVLIRKVLWSDALEIIFCLVVAT